MNPGDDAAPGVGARGERDDILLGGGVNTDSMSSTLADEVSDAAEFAVAGALLSARDIECARRLIDFAPTAAYRHPVTSFVVNVADALVEEGTLPSPLSVATYALQQGISLPVRQTPVAALARIAADSLVCGDPGWAARQVALNHHRRTISTAAARISSAAWSDPTELAELIDRELTAITEAVQAVIG